MSDVKIGVAFRPFYPRLPGPGSQHQEPFLTQLKKNLGDNPSLQSP